VDERAQDLDASGIVQDNDLDAQFTQPLVTAVEFIDSPILGADVELAHQPEQYQHGESVVPMTHSG